MQVFKTTFRKLLGVEGTPEYETRKEKTEKLFKLIKQRARIEKEMDEQEDLIIHKYNLITDYKFDEFVSSHELKTKEPRYYQLKQAQKNVIKKCVLAERENFNFKKGIYLGLGANLIDISLDQEVELVYIDWSMWENHAEILGTTRYGKTYILAIIAYQMILKGWDIIQFDPKGGKRQELLSWMIEFAMEAKRHEDIMFFNPAYVQQSNYLNPIHGLENSEIASIVSLLTRSDSPNAGGEQFFSDVAFTVTLANTTALEFLQESFDIDGSIAARLEEQEFKKYFELMEIRGHILQGFDKKTAVATPDASQRMTERGEKTYENLRDAKFEFNRSLITFADLAYYANYDNFRALYEFVQKTKLPSRDSVSIEKYNKIVRLKSEALGLMVNIARLGDLYEKISLSLITLLSNLSTGPVGELFCTVRINPMINRVYREDKGLIAIVQPAPLKYEVVSNLVNKVFLKMFQSLFGKVSVTGRGFERRICLSIDEAKAVLFPGIDDIYNKAGGMGMTILTLMQSEKDRILKLGETMSSILSDNINIHIYMKINNEQSKRNIVNDFGTMKVIKRNSMSSTNDLRLMLTSEDQNILTTNHIDKLRKGEAYISFYGKKYKIKFPYILPPKGEIIMPETENEKYFRNIVAIEQRIEQEINLINVEMQDNEVINTFKEIRERF